MKNTVRNIATIITLILCSCANVVTPSGGPKDQNPPVVLNTSPENHSTNFKGKTISLTFDEYVTLNNPSNNVLVSPPTSKKPTFRTSGKTLIIKFEEPLIENTTYSINFGDAIKDLHEGNVFNGYTFHFSTGDKIDSLSLKGKVTSASTLTPMEGFFVGLYDSLPYHSKPKYVTTTDKAGNFEFSGLSDKKYLLFALKDNNYNMIYDLPNEEIAFHSDSVRPYFIDNHIIKNIISDILANDTTVVNDTVIEMRQPEYPVYELFSFVQEDSIQKIFKKELVEEGLLRFVFRYPAPNVAINALEKLPDSFNIMPVYSSKKDTVLWYFTPCKDSLMISINDGANICDTTHYSLKPRQSAFKRRRSQENDVKKLVIKNNIKANKLKPKQPVILTLNEPIIDIHQQDSMIFIENQDTVFRKIKFEKLDEYGLKYQIVSDLKPENRYQLIIPDSVFFGFRNVTNDTIRLNFLVQEEAAFGNIYITVDIPENVPQVIVELLSSNNKTIDKQILTNSQELSFEFLDPGKYQLKAILDTDANGEWSPGNFDKKLQPEKIVFYKNALEVRANWDIDMDEPWQIEN